MKLVLILALAILNFCNCQNDESVKIEGRITGGQETTLNQFPYQVLIHGVHSNGVTIFGGSLISSKIVLTTARYTFLQDLFNVHFGATYSFYPAIAAYSEFNVTSNRVKVHENYNLFTFQNNLAIISIIEIPQNILSLPTVGLVDLPTATEASINLEGMTATISGYGFTNDFPGSWSSGLLFITVPIISNTECENSLRNALANQQISDANFCTSGANSRNACPSDEGSPVTVEISGRRVLVGMPSILVSSGCTLGYPTGHVRITSHLQWIEENLNFVPTTTTLTTTVSTTTQGGSTSTENTPTTTESGTSTTVLDNETTPGSAVAISGKIFAIVSVLILAILK